MRPLPLRNYNRNYNRNYKSVPDMSVPFLSSTQFDVPFWGIRPHWVWASLFISGGAMAESTIGRAPEAPPTSTNAMTLETTTVVGHLDEAREQIVPSLGATSYLITKDQLLNQAQGANAAFSQVLLRAPGVAQDSYGQLHVRGEHANLQYRINDVLLPEGITGFGQELDTRFVDSISLVTGTLPAQYGFRTAGIVDIHTKSGSFGSGGAVDLYGGSFDTVHPSFEYGAMEGKLSFFSNGGYTHSGLGVENPTSSYRAIHDLTDQYKLFSYLSYVLDETSRLSVMASGSYGDFQIPNTPGLPAGTAPGGDRWLPGSFDSRNLNENQREQNLFGVLAYQKSVDDLNLQIAGFGRNSGVHFRPDPTGDLYFNGVSSDVARNSLSTGLQADLSYNLTDRHTLRGGSMLLFSSSNSKTETTVFDLDPISGNPVGGPRTISDSATIRGQFYGFYLQDEWQVLPKVTVNYGGRFDTVGGYLNEHQISPRANLIYEVTDTTKLHGGYARYFTPPPLENVSHGTLSKFAGTSNDQGTNGDAVTSERAHYFDLGVTQQLLTGLHLGVDGYYKIARNQLDEGLFGQTLIPAAFNYERGEVYGIEISGTYDRDGLSSYANVAVSRGRGKQLSSSQFLFGPDELSYAGTHWVALDHDQEVTGSFGVSYHWDWTEMKSRVFADALYGSGLRRNLILNDGSVVPNGGTVPPSYTINIGFEEAFKMGGTRWLKARIDLVNLTDNVYEIRDGSGVGVNAAQYGMRRGIFGSLSYAF